MNAFISLLLLVCLLGGCSGAAHDKGSILTDTPMPSGDPGSPTETVYKEYARSCESLKGAESKLKEAVKEARKLLESTGETDVLDSSVLSNLSDSLEAAAGYKDYSFLPTAASDPEPELQKQLESVNQAYGECQRLESNLKACVLAVKSSIESKKELIATQMAKRAWPGTPYVMTYTDANGYTYRCTLKTGSWIRANDTEMLNAAWKNIGGTGDVPNVTDFNKWRYYTGKPFYEDTAVMAFATFEAVNVTSGYNATESHPLTPTVQLILNKDDGYWIEPQLGYAMQVLYGNNPQYSFNITPNMTTNRWGPVIIILAFADAFGPNYGENGNPVLERAFFKFYGIVGFGPFEGVQTFQLPRLWVQ